MRKIKRIGWLLLTLVSLLGGAHRCFAQCSDSSTVIYWIDSLYRTSGNNVEAIIGTQVVGDYSDYWDTYVSGSEFVNSNQINSGYDGQQYGANDVPGSAGAASGWTWNNAPSNVGDGSYTTSSYHQASSACGEFQDTSLSDSLTVNKPTISGIDAEWYLGSTGQNQSGFGSTHPMTANSNCGANDSCPETPSWTVSGDITAITLGCNPCTNQILYAQHSSPLFRDIQLSVDIGGFSSDPLLFTVYVPWTITLFSYSDGPQDDGFNTQATLSLYDRFGDEITGLASNENFDQTDIADYPNLTKWGAPQPTGAAAGWPVLGDNMSASGGCSQAIPQCSNPPAPGGTLSTTMAMHNLQNWYSGSPTPGNGLKIRTDTQQYYTDHGRYTNEVSPLPGQNY